MENHWKKNIDVRVEHFKSFYERRNERPLFGFYYGSEYPIHRYPSGRDIPENTILTPEHFSVPSYLDDFDMLFDRHEECGGDFIWSASIFWGIPWVEAALGCPILLSSYSSGSIHAEAMPGFKGAESIPEFSLEDPWIRLALDFLEQTAARSKGRYPLATTRMRGISDLLSLLYETENLVMKMFNDPDEIHLVSEKLCDFWIEFGKMQIDRIPEFHGGIGSFYYNCWAPRGTIWHQEDAAALLSPDLYDAFIRKWDEKIVNAFEGCIMHQHSNGYFPYEYYLKMNFTALELHIDEGGPSAESLKPVYESIMRKVPLIIWGDIPEKDLEWIFRNLPPEGLAIITVVNDPDEAGKLWEKYIS